MGMQFNNNENYQKLKHVAGKETNKDNKYLVK